MSQFCLDKNKKISIMETERKIKLLQLFYAGVLADSTANYERFGILKKVTEKKSYEQKVMAPGQLAQLGVSSPEQLFEISSEIFGCIKWQLEKYTNYLIARGNRCMLCSIAKKMDIAQPCYLFCINPFSGLVSELESGWNLKVNETLWDGTQCEFEMRSGQIL
jgi:hypothetical protein